MAKVKQLGHVRFRGLRGTKNVSGVSLWGRHALVVVDETIEGANLLQIFEPEGDDYRALPETITLDIATSSELDLEGIAVEDGTVFLLGSHAWRRRAVEDDKPYLRNRANLLGGPEAQPARDYLIRLALTPEGTLSSMTRMSLRPFFDSTEPFKSFASIASKENGIDAEGLTVRSGWVYVGFRGPVLRGNFTPILKLRFDEPPMRENVSFVNLGGRGVRDLATVEDGIIILAGPVGDGPGSYQFYLWDGQDGVPGEGAPPSETGGLQFIGDLPPPESRSDDDALAKPEGIALVEETRKHWLFMVACDGVKHDRIPLYRVDKP